MSVVGVYVEGMFIMRLIIVIIRRYKCILYIVFGLNIDFVSLISDNWVFMSGRRR